MSESDQLRGYPEEWVRAAERGLAATKAAGSERYALYLLLDHLVPVIEAGRHTIDVHLAASNEGSVPGANLTAIDVTEFGVDAVVEFMFNRLLEQIIERCDKVLEVSSDVRRVETAGVLGEILEDVRAERRDA